jgi:glycosyltransferase
MTDNIKPQFTFAIPTFHRNEFLRQALKSAIQQKTTTHYEILIIDNDPSSTFADELSTFVGINTRAHLRYIRNSENIGMFGNWNKCLQEATADWMTILSDDDAVHHNFLETILPFCNADFSAVAVGKQKFSNNASTDLGSLMECELATPTVFKKIYKPVFNIFNPIGTPAGLSFNRKAAFAVGGYDPEFYPSADYKFVKDLASIDPVILTRTKLAFVGIGDNASMHIETLRGFYEKDIKIRQIVPSALNKFIGLLETSLQGKAFNRTVSESTGISRFWNWPVGFLSLGFKLFKSAILYVTSKKVIKKSN